ncbi:hypothetical protein AMECASPLE_033377 [Ameca splendens]|uniref:Uncharacterized protein n=1 Tax=Ameca splendens TaxID=208324 RepID=A0ABV1AD82_9TELE
MLPYLVLSLSLFHVHSNKLFLWLHLSFPPSQLCSFLLPQLLHMSSDCSTFSLPRLQLIHLISSSSLPVSLPLAQRISGVCFNTPESNNQVSSKKLWNMAGS